MSKVLELSGYTFTMAGDPKYNGGKQAQIGYFYGQGVRKGQKQQDIPTLRYDVHIGDKTYTTQIDIWRYERYGVGLLQDELYLKRGTYGDIGLAPVDESTIVFEDKGDFNAIPTKTPLPPR